MSGFRLFMSAALLASFASGSVFGQDEAAKAKSAPPATEPAAKAKSAPPSSEPAANAAPDASASVPPTDTSSGLPAKRPITIRVYKLVNGSWLERPERQYEVVRPTDKEYRTAVEYMRRVKRVTGWTATWEAPDWPFPRAELITRPQPKPTTSGPSGPGTEPPPPFVPGVWAETSGYTYIFEHPGSLKVIAPKGTALGTWSQSGKSLTFSYRWPGAPAPHTYKGTIDKYHIILKEEYIYVGGYDLPRNRLLEHRDLWRKRWVEEAHP